ncbi:MAG: acyl-CoA dehydrogenase, partial [Acidimicrobiaceae bacterium]|nr:acyl-CoA dehydrogenase [Acidimicrobiaceae bacterium]
SKLMLAEFNKELTAKVLDLEGPAAMVDYDYEFRRPTAVSLDGKFGDTHHGFLRARANSIEGGTSEIMRNILGEQVLGLPGEPRVDKEIPWREVPRN